MKTSAKHAATEVPREASRTLLDWPREAGLSGELRAKVSRHVRTHRARKQRVVGAAALAMLAVVVVFWIGPYWRDTSNVVTLSAQRQALTTADGSQIDLNAQTELHTDFRYHNRTVRLERGEAFFSVAKDPRHPFLVETPAGVVRVTGTQFNVRLDERQQLAVTLLEGSVEIVLAEQSDAGTQTSVIKLIPGQQFASSTSGVQALTSLEMETVVAWRQGEIVLDGLTLAEAAKRLASYHGKKIEVAPEIAELSLGGVFPQDDLSRFLNALQTVFPVRVLTQGDGSLRLVKK